MNTKLCILACFLLMPLAVQAASPVAELKQLIGKIHTLQSNLTQTQKQQTTVQQQLKQSEVAIGNSAIAIKQTTKKLADEHVVLQKLNIEQNEYQRQLVMQKQAAFQELRAAYMLGNDSYFKILLNQENPEDLDRTTVYYQYLMNSRERAINAVLATLHKLHQNNEVIQKQTKILQGLFSRQANEKQQLEQQQKARSLTLSTVQAHLKDQRAKMQKLLADKAALEQLIKRIEEQIKARERAEAEARARNHAKPSVIPKGIKFLGNLRGKLLSPTRGRLESSGGESRLNGVIIAGQEGEEVHAIAAGRVVFADWLRGYGLLLIIDHGHGYMSLYGRNHSLYKKTNDMVATGEAISSIGNSGGYDKPGLYFAMRYNGKPIDPTIWCNFH